MKSYTELLQSKGVKVGNQIDHYYGNGKFYGVSIVTRISEYFIFHQNERGSESRDSHNSVLGYLKKGIWRVKELV